MADRLKYVALLLLLVVQCVFLGLGAKPMYKVQEVRVAETAREMNANQDWLVPYYNGEVRLRKPPLAYWLTAASYGAFGAVDEFSARFASATFAGLLVFTLFFWMRRHLSVEAALIAVASLISTYMGLRYFRSAETDAILLLFVSAACVIVYQLLYVGVSLPRVLALHLCMGLGFLTKGPAALAMPLAVLVVLGLKDRRYPALKAMVHPLGLLMLFLAAAGWYALIYFKLTDVATYWVGEEIDATYVTGKRANPFYWYALNLFQFFAPWSLLIVPAAIWYWKTRPHGDPVRFALVWFATTFVILSANVNKQMQYALLLAPPLAILLGHYLASAEGRYAKVNRGILYVLFAGVAAAFAAALWKRGGDAVPVGLLIVVVGTILPLALAKLLRIDLKSGFAVLLLTGVISSAWVYGQINGYDGDSDEGNVKAMALAAKEHNPLYVFGGGNPRISFYAQRVVPHLDDAAQVASSFPPAGGAAYLIVEGKPPAWPSGVEATEMLTHGRLHLWQLQSPSLSR